MSGFEPNQSQLPSQPGNLSYVSRAELPASKFTIPGVQMQMLISDLAWTPKLISSGASSSRMNIQDLAFLLGLDLYGNQLMKACAVIFFHSWCRFLAFSLSKTAFAARRKIWMPVETLSKHFTDFSGESENLLRLPNPKSRFRVYWNNFLCLQKQLRGSVHLKSEAV